MKCAISSFLLEKECVALTLLKICIGHCVDRCPGAVRLYEIIEDYDKGKYLELVNEMR